MQKKKLFNFRPFLIIAITIIIAIIFAVFVTNSQPTQLIISFIFLLSSISMLIIYLIKKRKVMLFLSVMFIFIAGIFISIDYKSFNYAENLKYENSQVYVIGKICDYYKITKNGYLQIMLDEVDISCDDEVERINGKIAIYTNPDYMKLSDLKVGGYVLAELKLDFNDLNSKDKWELMNLSKNIVAAGFANYYNIKIYTETDMSFADNLRDKIFGVLKTSNMKNSDLIFAMFFGDSNIVDSEVKSIFQGTGIAHLLAVSGLHVSAIVFALSFILKKLKISQKWRLALLSSLLLFYAYLCDFSISVIRASLMAIALNYSYMRGKPYDRLSVLSLVAIAILIVNPLQLFNISFVLSFMAVLSIILLAGPISKILKKIFYDKFANTLGVLFAVQIGLMAVNAFYFNSFQPLSFLANMISIPLATFAFILGICATILTLIFPFMSFLCKFIGELFEIVVDYNSFIKGLNVEILLPEISVLLVIVSLLVMFVVSDYCFVKKRTKIITAISGLLLCSVLFFI